MIAIDGSPLVWGPVSVARIVRAWLAGWPADRRVRLLLPAGVGAQHGLPSGFVVEDARRATTPRAFRRRLAALAADVGAEGFVAPWAAFPRDLPREIPLVVLVHELPFVRHGPIEGRARAWRHKRWLVEGARRGVTWITPSEATRADLRAFLGQAAPPVHVVPPGFDPSPWIEARRPPAAPPYVVMLGMGHGRRGAFKKGLDLLLAAWRRGAPDGWRLVLAGRVRGALPEGVEAVAPLGGDALHLLVAGASLLVYPSRSEGFGFPPLEAMAAGVPVLASDAGAIPATVGDAAHVVAAGDVAALAAGLRRLSADTTLRETLCARGAVRAGAFAPAASARALLEAVALAAVSA